MNATNEIQRFDVNRLGLLCGEQLLLTAILGGAFIRRSIDRELKRRTRRVLLRYGPDNAANATARIHRTAISRTAMEFAA